MRGGIKATGYVEINLFVDGELGGEEKGETAALEVKGRSHPYSDERSTGLIVIVIRGYNVR